MTVEEILQLTADAARSLLGGTRATVAIFAPDPRLRPLTATSPQQLGAGAAGAGAAVRAADRPRQELGTLEVVDGAGREFSARDERDPHQLAQPRLRRDLQRPALRARAHDRPHAPALPAPRRACPTCPAWPPPCASVPRARTSSSAATSTTSTRRATAAWAALIGDVQGKGPDAAAVTALARHTLRAGAVYEQRPSGVLALLHRRCASSAPTAASAPSRYAHMQIAASSSGVELACGGHPLPLVVHPDGRVEPVGRLGTLLGTDIEPQLDDVTVELALGDVLLLYTDGVTEVRRRRREVFGHQRADRAAAHVRRAAARRGRRSRRSGGAGRLRGPAARRHGDPRPRAHARRRRSYASRPTAPSTEDIDG